MVDEKDYYLSSSPNSNTAIILLQMGGPYSIELVEPFLYNLFTDGDIIQLPIFLRPLQKFIAKMIVRKRLEDVIENYKLIGGGSPIFEHTSGLTKNIFNLLTSENVNVDITFIMRYSEPRAEKIIEIMKSKEIQRVILFPLYPHYSNATTGSSVKDFVKTAEMMNFSPQITEIEDWGLEQFYLNWWINEIKKIPGTEDKNLKFLFTAHGLPQRYIDKGDPYLDSLKPCVDQIMKNFPEHEYKLSFQSNVGPVEWLRPYTTDAITELKDGANSRLMFIPIGFVSDHIETLQEIDLLYTDQAKESGFVDIKRVPVPNSSVIFAEGIVEFLSPYVR